MQISDKALDEFIKIYSAEFGQDVDRKEALEMAQRVFSLYRLLTRRLPKEHTSPPDTTPHDDRPAIGFQT